MKFLFQYRKIDNLKRLSKKYKLKVKDTKGYVTVSAPNYDTAVERLKDIYKIDIEQIIDFRIVN